MDSSGLGMKSGLNIEPGHALGLIKETAESAFLLGLELSYNLAPIINSSPNISPIFDFTFGVIIAELTEDAIDNERYSFYFGTRIRFIKSLVW